MNFLIFGPEEPKLSFTQDPRKGTIARCENEYVLDYNPNKPITWRDAGKVLGLVKHWEDWDKEEKREIELQMLKKKNEEKDKKEFEIQEIWENIIKKIRATVPNRR